MITSGDPAVGFRDVGMNRPESGDTVRGKTTLAVWASEACLQTLWILSSGQNSVTAGRDAKRACQSMMEEHELHSESGGAQEDP